MTSHVLRHLSRYPEGPAAPAHETAPRLLADSMETIGCVPHPEALGVSPEIQAELFRMEQRLKTDIKAEILLELSGTGADIKTAGPPVKDEEIAEAEAEATDAEVLRAEDGHPYECALEGSVWDATLLCGTPALGLGATAFIALLIVLNLLIQGVFVGIVSEAFTEKVYTESSLQSLRLWRRNIAHDVKNMDPLTQKSMALRVCELEPGLSQSASQMSQYQALDAYVSGNIGPIMCTLAIICWILSVSREVNRCVDFAHCVLVLPRNDHTAVSRTEGVVRVTSVSTMRVAIVLAGLACRVTVAVLLLCFGIIFLINTIGLGDLLLNAVALEFVISIDELIFDALAPNVVRSLISAAAPLVHPPLKRWRGLDLKSAGTLLCVVLVLVVSFFSPAYGLLGTLKSLKEAHTTLCGGSLDWVYGIDGASAARMTFDSRVYMILPLSLAPKALG